MASAPTASRRQHLGALVAISTVVLSLGLLARQPSASRAEVDSLAVRFSFAVHPLEGLPLPAGKVEFPANPIARHMGFYLYQIGASAALGDLDGDGLANDLCLTDPRTKSATVSPIPGTGERYAPFVLDFGAWVDRRTVHPTVCRIVDANEDGRADLFLAFYGRAPLFLLQRASDERALALDRFQKAELVEGGRLLRWWTSTATFADFDGDGHADLVVGNYYPDGAELTDATSSVPFEMNDSFSRARNGGTNRLFRFVGAETGAQPTIDYRDAGDVFPADGERGWTLALGAADLDGDALPELYVANDFGPDELLANRSTRGDVRFELLHGPKGFATPESMVLGQDSFKGMSIDFADLNDDGIFDFFVSNIGSPFALQESHFLWLSEGETASMRRGRAPWRDRGHALGVGHSAWAWDARFEDFDRDGRFELVQATGLVKGERNRWADLAQVGVGNDRFVHSPASWPKFAEGSEVDGSYPNPLWVLSKTGRYVDVASEVFPGLRPATRGIAVADVEGDGDIDLVYANFWEDSTFVENRAADEIEVERRGGAFLGLHLLLPLAAEADLASLEVHGGHPRRGEGVPALGARVEITLPEGRRIVREVDGGNGHSGQRSPELFFGLGELPAGTKSIPARIRWRDRTGSVRNAQLTLAPGWQTVVLGTSRTRDSGPGGVAP